MVVEVREAFFDGSTQDGRVLIVAGYMADTDTWLRFSDAWQEKIDTLDNGRPFKMSRASKTAKGMRRAQQHYRLIQDFGLVGVGCAVPIEPLRRLVVEYGLDPRMANPYFTAWRMAISAAITCVKSDKSNAKIQFCFDEQTEKVLILKAWDLFHANAPAQYRRHIARDISFKPDDDVMPLQAADLFAGLARMQYVKDPSAMAELAPKEWNARSPNVLFTRINETGLRRLFEAEVHQGATKGTTVDSFRFSTADEPYAHWPKP